MQFLSGAKVDAGLGDFVKIRAIHEAVDEMIFANNPRITLPMVYSMLRLIGQEGIGGACVVRTYDDAYAIAAATGDSKRARIFAERAYGMTRLMDGDDSPTLPSAAINSSKSSSGV